MRLIFPAIFLLIPNTFAAHAQDASTELAGVADAIRSSSCTTNCKAGEWSYASVSLPTDVLVGGRKVFIVSHPIACGSGGCMSNILAIGPEDAHLLGAGFDAPASSSQKFSLPQSPHIQSVSASTLISGQSTASGTQVSEPGFQGGTFNDRFPATKAEVDLVFSGQPLIRDAINEVADQFIQAILSPGFQNLLPKQIAISPDDILNQIFLNPDQFTTHVGGGLKGFGQNVAYEAVRGAAITILSQYLAEAFVAEGAPLGFIDSGLKVYVEVMLATGLEEFFFAFTSGSLESAVVEGVFRRAWDFVDIAIATKGVLKGQDRAILATVAGIESAVDLELGRPTPEGEALADRIYQDLVDRAAPIYGTDDEDSIRKIFNLTKVALINQKSGHLDKAKLLRDRIVEVGFQSSNIHPIPLITNPTDWVAAALSLGKDAPERVAQIAIQGTSLGQVEQPEPLPSCISIGRDLTTLEIIKSFGNKIMTVGYAIPDVVPHRFKIGPLEHPNEFVTYLPILNDTAGGAVVPHKVRVANDKLCEENKYGEFCSKVAICDSDDALYVLDPSSQSPGYVIGLDPDGTASGETPIQTDGALCRDARTPLTTSTLKQYFWGSKISGTNVNGAEWQEYLARGGDVANTIFVNSSGKETIGVYKFSEGNICFSYGTVAKWNCKTISICNSGEALYVIADLLGKQTSLVKEIEPYGHAPYHMKRWDTLVREQDLAVPIDNKPREYTAIPVSHSRLAKTVADRLTHNQVVTFLDAQQCNLRSVSTSAIVKQVTSGGGWSDWMGSTQNGQAQVGQSVQTYTLGLEKIDLSKSGPAGTNQLKLIPMPNSAFHLHSENREGGVITQSFQKSVSEIGFYIPSSSTLQETWSNLSGLARHCRGETALNPAQSAAPAKTTAAPALQSTDNALESHSCSSVDNDIARLQCFDGAFPKGNDNSAVPSARLSSDDLSAMRELIGFNMSWMNVTGSPNVDQCTLALSQISFCAIDGSRGNCRQDFTIPIASLDIEQSRFSSRSDAEFIFAMLRGSFVDRQVYFGAGLAKEDKLRRISVHLTRNPLDYRELQTAIHNFAAYCVARNN